MNGALRWTFFTARSAKVSLISNAFQERKLLHEISTGYVSPFRDSLTVAVSLFSDTHKKGRPAGRPSWCNISRRYND